MIDLRSASPCLCAAGEEPEPTRPPPRPRALAGSRITAAARARLLSRRRFVVAVHGTLSTFERDDEGTLRCTVELDDEASRVHGGLDVFDRALSAQRAMRTSSLARAEADVAIERALDAAARWARASLRRSIDAALERAREDVSHARAFALDCVDESPSDRRARVAAAGAALVARTLDLSTPRLSLAALALLSHRTAERVASWRLSSDGRAVALESRSSFTSGPELPRCPRCEQRARAFGLCPLCADARCERCARRCVRCQRASCEGCARGDRCPHCGLSMTEGAAR